MRELGNDPFYEIIKEYDRCVIDYCLVEDERPYHGKDSHGDAVQFAMGKVIERYMEFGDEEESPWKIYTEKVKAHPVDAASLLYVPDIKRMDYYGNRFYDCEWSADNRGGWIPYWYAFLEPPHGTGQVAYGPEDFQIVNDALFPQGTDNLEIYEWTTDWSEYFDDGHEWWGSACWSVYDPLMNRYAVIMVSYTD